MLNKGLIQIYTGNGKGKTTAALGLALRACGDDNSVLFYQFLKPGSLDLSERKAIAAWGLPIYVDTLDIEWNMLSSLNDPTMLKKTAQAVELAIEKITQLASEKRFNVIILDEIVYCHSKGLVSTKQLQKMLENRDPAVEIIMTGRNASDELIELADLVSEITPIKHPYDKGIPARKGIEY